MTDLIKNLRQKPEETRKQIAWIATVVAGLILIAFWLVFLISKFNEFSKLQSNAASPLSKNVSETVNQGLPTVSSSLKNILGILNQKNEPENEITQPEKSNTENKTPIIGDAKPAKLPVE